MGAYRALLLFTARDWANHPIGPNGARLAPVGPDLDLNKLATRLSQQSSASVISGIHVLSFQPGRLANEDRCHVEDWLLPNGTWKMLAIFDGHGAGTEAVEFVLATLPATIKTAISRLPMEEDISDSTLGEILRTCVRDVDMRIQEDFVSLFPADIGTLSDDDIREAIRDPESAEGNSRVEVLRARTGTTALVALIKPDQSIHVANLGDCDAVVGVEGQSGWTSILSVHHNCTNEHEVARIRAEHPGEPECVNTTTERTLGLIGVTRGKSETMGDMFFKLPATYAERAAPLSLPPMHPNYDLKGLAARNITPPYLSNEADVVHFRLPHRDPTALPWPAQPAAVLILASDGLFNLFSRTKKVRQVSEAASMWCHAAASGSGEPGRNMALNILWDALQHSNGHNLYVDMISGEYGRRVDDTTIVVCPL
ncbi:phosphatase 2C-like domain-containing protein [Mycena pura]|uniref:Phosphatase 2C-like domain-containing protein n=1 Tax=Mycena pura TaxID=153505 RepID=A0AAD6YMC6_9AGAR|nr:phosphatase 2C-like domain-containing protein [Mycena pura]